MKVAVLGAVEPTFRIIPTSKRWPVHDSFVFPVAPVEPVGKVEVGVESERVMPIGGSN